MLRHTLHTYLPACTYGVWYVIEATDDDVQSHLLLLTSRSMYRLIPGENLGI